MLLILKNYGIKIFNITDLNGVLKLFPSYLNAHDKKPDGIKQLTELDYPGNNSKGVLW